MSLAISLAASKYKHSTPASLKTQFLYPFSSPYMSFFAHFHDPSSNIFLLCIFHPCFLLNNFWATVCITVCPMLSVCLSSLSVMLMYCSQPAGRIKMKLGTQVGLGLATLLDGDTAPPSKKGAERPQFSTHICCGQMDGWIKMPLGSEVRPQTKRRCVRGGPSFPSAKRGALNFQPTSVVAKWLDGSRCHLVRR